MIREIVKIDEEKCDGCGLCIPACHEGAIQIIDGKARVINDRMCDGLGACLGHCPRCAITIEKRDAEAFDEEFVAASATQPAHAGASPLPQVEDPAVHAGGCPGSRVLRFERPETPTPPTDAATDAPSELTHWPVQLNLLPPHAPVLRDARLLVAADCVPVAYADFHRKLLRGRTVLIGCPKFDDLPGYVGRLTAIISQNRLREIVVARMEVPCCNGILAAVCEARQQAGVAVPIVEVIIGRGGNLLGEREIPVEPAA